MAQPGTKCNGTARNGKLAKRLIFFIFPEKQSNPPGTKPLFSRQDLDKEA